MKKFRAITLTAITLALFIMMNQAVLAEETTTTPPNKVSASVEASDARDFGDDVTGGWGSFGSAVYTSIEGGTEDISARAKTQGTITGVIDVQALETRSDSKVTVENSGETSGDGPSKITASMDGERSSWTSQNDPEHGYAWSGNYSKFSQGPANEEGCGPLDLNYSTTAFGKNRTAYTIEDPSNKSLNIYNQTGVTHEGSASFLPATVYSESHFGGAVWGYGTRAGGEASGTLNKLGTITGTGNYRVYSVPASSGIGSVTGAEATTTITRTPSGN